MTIPPGENPGVSSKMAVFASRLQVFLLNPVEELLDALFVGVGILGEGVGVHRSVSHPHFLIALGLGFVVLPEMLEGHAPI